jgi:uncharacterized protein (TIGR02246 family)
MNPRTPRHPLALPAIALLCAVTVPSLAAQDVPSGTSAAEVAQEGMDETLVSLGEVAGRFVAAFNDKNAEAIAALFIPTGTIIDTNGGTLSGRQVIGDYYHDLFAGEQAPLIALEASEARLIAPGIAVEEGVVHLTVADDEPIRSVSYTVTHVKQADGSWLMASSRSLAEVTTPSERIKPLHWLVGEWTLESENGMRIDMVIDLDERGNFLLGEALVTDAEQAAQTTNLRIGWNPATSSVSWWTFDGDGGNATGSWVRRGNDWLINNTGITADGEVTASSQTLVRNGDSMVWTASQRVLAGEAMPDLTYRFVRRAPDPMSLLSPEDAGPPSDATPTSDGE